MIKNQTDINREKQFISLTIERKKMITYSLPFLRANGTA